MDDFSHLAWSFLVFHWTGQVLLAMLFGVLPDLIAFVPMFFYQIGHPRKEKDFLKAYKTIPKGLRDYAEGAYKVTHNIFALLAMVLLGILLGWWWALAWILHVLMDIPTHSKEFYPTPIFWPLSDWSIDGIPWSDKRVMIPNVILLLAGFALYFAHVL